MSISEYRGYNTVYEIHSTKFDKKDIFVKLAKIIYEEVDISKLYEYQNVITSLVSDMTNITSKVNRLSMAERNHLQYKYQFNGCEYSISVNEGKKMIKNELSLKLDDFINYLKKFNNLKINQIAEQLVVIFNNLKEEQIVRDYTKQIFSDAEKSLTFTKDNLHDYINHVQNIENYPKTKNNLLENENEPNNANRFLNCLIWTVACCGLVTFCNYNYNSNNSYTSRC